MICVQNDCAGAGDKRTKTGNPTRVKESARTLLVQRDSKVEKALGQCESTHRGRLEDGGASCSAIFCKLGQKGKMFFLFLDTW